MQTEIPQHILERDAQIAKRQHEIFTQMKENFWNYKDPETPEFDEKRSKFFEIFRDFDVYLKLYDNNWALGIIVEENKDKVMRILSYLMDLRDEFYFLDDKCKGRIAWFLYEVDKQTSESEFKDAFDLGRHLQNKYSLYNFYLNGEYVMSDYYEPIHWIDGGFWDCIDYDETNRSDNYKKRVQFFSKLVGLGLWENSGMNRAKVTEVIQFLIDNDDKFYFTDNKCSEKISWILKRTFSQLDYIWEKEDKSNETEQMMNEMYHLCGLLQEKVNQSMFDESKDEDENEEDVNFYADRNTSYDDYSEKAQKVLDRVSQKGQIIHCVEDENQGDNQEIWHLQIITLENGEYFYHKYMWEWLFPGDSEEKEYESTGKYIVKDWLDKSYPFTKFLPDFLDAKRERNWCNLDSTSETFGIAIRDNGKFKQYIQTYLTDKNKPIS